MKKLKRLVVVVVWIIMLLSVGYLGFTCKRMTNETIDFDTYENTAFDKNADTMVAFTSEIK